jgi:hypothetical protein
MGRRGYPPEFRRKVLDLIEAGRKVADVARDLPLCQARVRQDEILNHCPEGERGVHPYSEFDQRAGA